MNIRLQNVKAKKTTTNKNVKRGLNHKTVNESVKTCDTRGGERRGEIERRYGTRS